MSSATRKRQLPPSAMGKPKKQGKVDYFRPPTAEELKSLKETQNQFRSNFFRMQVEEYLKAVHNKQEKLKPLLDCWLDQFNSKFVQKLRLMDQKYDLSTPQTWLKDSVQCPVEATTGAGRFQFMVPKVDAFFIGSQAVNTTKVHEDSVCVDVAIEMPKEFFQTADYLNQVYHYKKALYLSYLMMKLDKVTGKLGIKERSFGLMHNSPLNVVGQLLIELDGWKGEVRVRVHLCFEENTYKLVRFIPSRNNVRPNTFFEDSSDEDLSQTATPHYNQSILKDLVLRQNTTFVQTQLANSNVSDAIILLKMWLKRRNLDEAFNSYMLTMFICYLVKSKKVNPLAMSCYQIVRLFFSHFKLMSFNDRTKGISLSDSVTEKQPTFDDLSQFYETSFMDITGFYNVFATLNTNILKRIKMEVEMSLQILDNPLVNSFQSLFMTDIPNSLQFDHIFHVSCNKSLQDAFLNRPALRQSVLNYCGSFENILHQYLEELLSKGLGNRVRCLQRLTTQVSSFWDVSDPRPSSDTIVLTYGLILNPDEAFDAVIKGPQANEAEAGEFQNFWGGKSQLRRFQDGTITEACVFGTANDPPTKKRLICQDIVEHLIRHHIPEIQNKPIVSYFANQLNCTIDIAGNAKSSDYPNGYDTETQSMDVILHFNEMDHDLRFMENLPLEITSIAGTSPIFYYCDPLKNLPNGFFEADSKEKPLIYGSQVYEAVLQLSVSGKWPDDLEAIKRLKAAFFLEIAKKLKGHKGYFVKVNPDSLEVLRKGYVFRFRLAHYKELQLMKQSTINGLVSIRDTDESMNFEKNMFIKPGIASALHGLHQQFNAFGPVVCLAKRWVQSQMLDTYLWPDECTELIVASMFLKDSNILSTPVVSQPQAGFLRFLHILANKNWQVEPLLLNFNETLTTEEIQAIESKFTMNRTQFPPLTIITSFDNKKYTGIWGKEAPIVQVLVRVILQARELLQKIDDRILKNERFNMTSCFQSSDAGYDAIITIDPNQAIFVKALVAKPCKRNPIGFRPVEMYLNELRVSKKAVVIPELYLIIHVSQAAYGEFAAFFCNAYRPEFIGVLWKPNVKLPRDFRIAETSGRHLVDGQLTFNVQAILRDFALLGTGLVTEIVQKN